MRTVSLGEKSNPAGCRDKTLPRNPAAEPWNMAGNLMFQGLTPEGRQARPYPTPNRVHLRCGRSVPYYAASHPASRRRSCASAINSFHGFSCAGSPTRRGCATQRRTSATVPVANFGVPPKFPCPKGLGNSDKSRAFGMPKPTSKMLALRLSPQKWLKLMPFWTAPQNRVSEKGPRIV